MIAIIIFRAVTQVTKVANVNKAMMIWSHLLVPKFSKESNSPSASKY